MSDPRRVLVADDHRDSARALARLLGVLGYEAMPAFGGREALELARSFRPDALVLDIGMEDLDGYEACRALRQEAWCRNATVIALTGWSSDADRERAAQAGFDHHLVKPVEIDALRAALRRRN